MEINSRHNDIPAMPKGDGTYYRFNARPDGGAPLVDALDRPVISVIGRAGSPAQIFRDMAALDEWIATSREGSDALKTLEAERQKDRMEGAGAAYSYRPTDVCGGGEYLANCETAGPMLSEAQEAASSMHEPDPADRTTWSTLAWLGRTCTACGLGCEVAVQLDQGVATGATRIANYKPLDLPVIKVDAKLIMGQNEQ